MRMIISIVITFLFVGFVTPASAFDFRIQTDDFSFAIGFPDNQGNQNNYNNNHYYEPQPQYQWPRNRQRRHQPQYNTPPSPPPGWVYKNDYERQGGHCGRIAYDRGEWFCSPE